jgi:hypothetical protein
MAMPFAWVASEEEAERLITLYSALNSKRGVHQIPMQWGSGDIDKAIKVCREWFGFPALERHQ